MFIILLRETLEDHANEILFTQIFEEKEEATDCFTFLTNAVSVELEKDGYILDLLQIDETTEELLPKVVYVLSVIQPINMEKEEFFQTLESKKSWDLKLLSVDYTGEEFYVETSNVVTGVNWKFTVEAETPELARKKAIRYLKKVLAENKNYD